MTLLSSERSAEQPPAGQPTADGGPLLGWQEPPIQTAPPSASSAGQEAVDLAAKAGLKLDPWQQHVLRVGMGEKPDGSWASFEVAVNVPRQNGKGGIIEARELWGLFIGGEQLILHSAHEFKTAKAAFKRIERLIRGCPDLHKRVKAYRYTVGEESIELHSGQVLRFIARSKGSGRGFTGDCNILDEDMILGDDAMDALLPTMAAVANPQIWYLGSAGIGTLSVQLARLRRRALAAIEAGVPDPSLAYMEWSADLHVKECPRDCTAHDDPASDEAVLKANPAVGYRLTLEKVAKERATLSPAGYARERLGQGEYPAEEGDAWAVIGKDAWEALAGVDSAPADPVAFAIDVTPERSHASICVAGQSGNAVHVEVVDNRPGTDWVVDRVRALAEKWRPRCFVVDTGSPAGSLIRDIKKRLQVDPEDDADGDEEPQLLAPVVEMKTRDVVQAVGQFYDAVAASRIVHLDQAPLSTALAGARKRDLGDAWAWARRGVGVDITPLVAATNARWGLSADVEEPEEEVEPWAEFG
ncbi:terminase [Streptomyces sp.]|uniref:terminase n=1 Tax=Streptomyces sp. TaxID=1931 RepID=UPI00281286DC|nr:terminase [Streptomyces sp.]